MIRQKLRSVLSQVGHRGRELWIHGERLRQPGDRPRVMFMLSDEVSGLLRGKLLAPELRALGWRVVVVPPHLELSQRRRLIALERPDVIVLQQHRHELNDPDLYPNECLVFDIDDADYLDERCVAAVQKCVSRSALVLAGSRNVARWCEQHNPRVQISWTPTPVPERRSSRPNLARGRVITWACSEPLSVPEEATFTLRTLLRVAEQEPFELWLFGARDMAKAKELVLPLERKGVRTRLIPLLPYDAFLRELEGAAIGLNPLCEADNPYAQGKSFGKTLAYLAAEVAVVTTRTVDHPLFFRQSVNGIMCDEEDEWVEAIVSLLRDPVRRQRMVDVAYADFLEKLTTPVAARRLDALLRTLVTERARARGALHPIQSRVEPSR